MRPASAIPRTLLLQLFLLVAALAGVAALQYRWIHRVSIAEHERMRTQLEESARAVAQGISHEFRVVFETFLQPEHDDLVPVVEQWFAEGEYRELVGNVYAADREGEVWTLRMYDRATRAFLDAQWPAGFAELRDSLESIDDRGPNPRWPRPFFERIPALFIVQLPAEMTPEFLIGRPRRIVILEINANVVQEKILPALVAQHLDANDDVKLVAPHARVSADVVVPVETIPPRRPEPPIRERPASRPSWQLAVTRHGGGIDAAVRESSRRQLVVSGLVLAVLAGAGVTLIALLRRGERLRMRQAQFVAAMSHELNTPLAALRLAGENIEDGLAQDPEKLARYAQTIVKESTRLSEMVGEVLELSGMRAPRRSTQREPIDLARIVDDAVAQCRAAIRNAVPIEVSVEPHLPKIHANEVAITRAVQNLIANALRHGGNDNAIHVRARRSDDGGVAIAIEDRGPGVEREDIPHLFEPFYRGRNATSTRGTGLGLTLVKEIVADHGGSVEYQPRSGGGSVFVMQLPGERDV
jgi:signal transduction histidine kinase